MLFPPQVGVLWYYIHVFLSKRGADFRLGRKGGNYRLSPIDWQDGGRKGERVRKLVREAVQESRGATFALISEMSGEDPKMEIKGEKGGEEWLMTG